MFLLSFYELDEKINTIHGCAVNMKLQPINLA